jgi:signal transduction histidine kinase
MEELNLDPIRQVRKAKFWAFAGIAWSLAVLLFAYSLTLDFSVFQLVLVVVPAASVAAIAVEFAARWESRIHRRYAYPHRLGYELSGIHDFDRACQRAVDLTGRWLDLDAVVIGWLSEDGEEIVPVAAYGMPDGWVETAPRVSSRAFDLANHVSTPRVLLTRRPAPGDPWFGRFFPTDRVYYAPLVSRDQAEGVVALTAPRGNPQIGDKRLLSALGLVMGLALDNCRLYEGQRANARHFQELNRMKSDFLTTVSHELRTPLTSIMMAAEMLLEEEETRDPDSPRGKLVRNIVKGASRMSSLVADLVAVSREDDFQPRLELEPMRLDDPVANAVAIVQPLLAAKRQTLEVRLAPDSGFARIDRLRFEQVLINLLSNAQRYSPPGGHVTVSTEHCGNEILISVEDSGSGVSKVDAEKIFEPFYRGDRSGLGLGLAIAKSIVELHNGRIWVEPGRSRGSRFCVSVPECASTDQPQATPNEAPPALRKAVETQNVRSA